LVTVSRSSTIRMFKLIFNKWKDESVVWERYSCVRFPFMHV